MTLEEVYTLMGTREIPGTAEELKILCVRISELSDTNGVDWVMENRNKLLIEWKQTLCFLNSAAAIKS